MGWSVRVAWTPPACLPAYITYLQALNPTPLLPHACVRPASTLLQIFRVGLAILKGSEERLLQESF